MNQKISAIINTYNEESNIQNCIESLTWVDEIIIVDMHSQDRTVEIAKRYTDKVFYFDNVGYVEPARQYAVNQAANDWILIVDADEFVPATLSEQLKNIANHCLADVVWISRKNYFFGKEMKGTGSGELQDQQLRFFRKEHLTFSNKIHSFPEVIGNGRVHHMSPKDSALLHFSYITAEQFLNKINLYTTKEAEHLFFNKKNIGTMRLLFHILKDTIGRFLFKKGYKDNQQGFLLSLILGIYFVIVKLKLNLMNKYGEADISAAVKNQYQDIIDRHISEYACEKRNSI